MKFLIALIFLAPTLTWALPIDWHGTLGFDTTSINNFRRLSKTTDGSNSGNAGGGGTQEVPLTSGAKDNANFQTYIFRLEPTIVVNDSASVKAELSSGYGRGGRVGDSSTVSSEPGFANSLYPYNFSDGNDALVINRLYMELYSDAATYLIGRHTYGFGLGALQNAGEGTWDRLPTLRDGITVKVQLSSFRIEPYWSRVGSLNSLTKATRAKEYGAALIYDSVERDLEFGILYGKKENAQFSTEELEGTTVNIPTNPDSNTAYSSYSNLGQTDVTMTDLYVKKNFGNFDFGIEVPIMSGEIGSIFGGNSVKYNSKAIIAEAGFRLNNAWSFGVKAGQVDGDSGSSADFGAFYVHPNYQIANLLFRYNLRAVSYPDGTNARNVFDSYINNARYVRLNVGYETEKWKWDGAVIHAIADQTAVAGTTAYNHQTNKQFNANYSQEDDLGTEVDLNFAYKWNSEVTVSGAAGYLFTGNYFGYTNTSAAGNTVDNSYILQLRTAVTF